MYHAFREKKKETKSFKTIHQIHYIFFTYILDLYKFWVLKNDFFKIDYSLKELVY